MVVLHIRLEDSIQHGFQSEIDLLELQAASLNFGDCLAYATAKLAKQPLLCVGDDFRQTDLDLVPY